MADLNFTPYLEPRQGYAVGTPSASAHACDATNDGIGIVFNSWTTDPITHLGYRYGARTGADTSLTYIIGLEGVSASTGNPDGTYLGGGTPASATFAPPSGTSWDGTWQWQALGNSYDPSLGELMAMTIRYSSGTISGANFASFTNEVSSLVSSGASMDPYSLRLTAGSWAKRASMPCFGYRTASGRYGYFWQSYFTSTVATQGHRAAMKFRLPSNATNTYQVAGLQFIGLIAAASGRAPKLCIWDASSELASLTLDSDVTTSPGLRQIRTFPFSSLVNLSAGTDYRIGLEVIDATNGTVSMAGFQLSEANDLLMFPGGTQVHYSSYNGSAWTDDQTVRPMAGLVLADMTQQSGAAGGSIIIGNGGPIIRGLY